MMQVFFGYLQTLTFVLLTSFASWSYAQITTREDEVGLLLNQWSKEGSANGLKDVYYENRDALHSPLEMSLFPQIQASPYTQEEIDRKQNVGPAHKVQPRVTFGNSSMAALPHQGGSLPRMYYTQPEGLRFLAAQYFQNNLFFYPEHQDHDLGENGNKGLGYGDLYPTNTPYTIISQGSSFTDLPFLKAYLSAYAAMSKEVQEGLVKSKLLMPIMQSLFRQSSRLVENEDDYLSGKAHPVVFDLNHFDEVRFVKKAHELRAETLPPVAALAMKSEPKRSELGYFFESDPSLTEVLADSPGAVARIFRGSAYQRVVELDASKSVDLFSRPLTYRWVLLQGDPEKVKIEPSSDGKTAKITVAWHPAFVGNAGIKTRRVEVGLFVNNGKNWSAPAFFTYYMLPNEQRYYDAQGKLAEIFYRAFNLDPGMPFHYEMNWLTLGRHLGNKNPPLAFKLFRDHLPVEAVEKLKGLSDKLSQDQARWRKLSEDPEKKSEADKIQAKLHEQITLLVGSTYAEGKPNVLQTVTEAFQTLAHQPDLFQRFQVQWLEAVKQAGRSEVQRVFEQSLKQVLDLQVMDPIGKKFALRYPPKDLIAGERYQMNIFNMNLFGEVLFSSFLNRRPVPELSDPRLSVAKNWRDMYRYDKQGNLLGWTRLTHRKAYEFDLQGRLLPQGRGGPAVDVSYQIDPATQLLIFVPKS